MNLINNDYWVRLFNVLDHETSFGLLVQMWIVERLPKPGPRQQQIANLWPLGGASRAFPYESLGENDDSTKGAIIP